MPNYWYNYPACEKDKYKQSICTDKKPYFMTYVYDDYRVEYNKFIKECDKSCMLQFGKKLDELLKSAERTDDEEQFLRYFYNKNPFGMGDCAMNRICHYIEDQFRGQVSKLKKQSEFDYKKLKSKAKYKKEELEPIKGLLNQYVAYIRETKGKQKNLDKDTRFENRTVMKKYFKKQALNICPDENKLLNMVLDLCYKHDGNKQFMWDCVGDLIVKRLEDDMIDNIQ